MSSRAKQSHQIKGMITKQQIADAMSQAVEPFLDCVELLMSKTNDSPATLLVADDGSPVAQAAANVAIQIAKCRDLLVRGLYVVDEALILDTYADYGGELPDVPEVTSRDDLIAWFKNQGESALRGLEARCQAAQVAATTDLLLGGVPEMVLREVDQAQLFALGRRGHGHARDSGHLGRNFRAIAHHTSRPMVVGGDEERRVQRLLLAYNEGEHAQHALAWAVLLQRALRSDVVVLNVKEDGHTSRTMSSELVDHLNQGGLTNYHLLSREGQPAEEIVAAAAENEVDLIVMGRYRHTALLEWLAGSTLDRVLRHTHLAVLVA
jgi:nucleotide-binding universal stress UspA family protein